MKDIVCLFAMGNEDAYRVIYDRYAVAMRYFAGSYLSDTSTIDDVVQDAFIVLWQRRKSFNAEPAIRGYLYSTVRSSCLNIIRHEGVKKRHRERVIVEDEVSYSFVDRIMEAEIFSIVSEAFEELTPACKRVYQMSLDGMSQKDISQSLDISVNTVKKHKNNAHHYLRERLKDLF